MPNQQYNLYSRPNKPNQPAETPTPLQNKNSLLRPTFLAYIFLIILVLFNLLSDHSPEASLGIGVINFLLGSAYLLCIFSSVFVYVILSKKKQVTNYDKIIMLITIAPLFIYGIIIVLQAYL